jgi:hypothetical protein
MKMIGLIFVICIAYASTVFAECRVVEYEDRNEVICEGVPAEKTPEPKRAETKSSSTLTQGQKDSLRELANENIERLRKKIVDLDREIIEQRNKPRPEDDIKVTNISAMEVERSYGYVTYSIKADVDNKGDRGNVFVKLVAKNRDGHQFDYVYLTGVIDRKSERVLRASTMVSLQHAMDIRTWDVESINKYYK